MRMGLLLVVLCAVAGAKETEENLDLFHGLVDDFAKRVPARARFLVCSLLRPPLFALRYAERHKGLAGLVLRSTEDVPVDELILPGCPLAIVRSLDPFPRSERLYRAAKVSLKA